MSFQTIRSNVFSKLHIASLLSAMFISSTSFAGAELSGGIWWVHQDAMDCGDSSCGDGDGEFADPALIIYASDDGSHGAWGFSGEMRIGTGSFSDPANNNSGDNFSMHKAWISYSLNEDNTLYIGKSQVPFGWKTSNFWPGDMLQGGYGDQMDVGLKFSGKSEKFKYDAAFYKQDDWGNSTDTVDDNGHWGSTTTYRKGKTLVLNGDYMLADGHTLGLSYQTGRLVDQVNVGADKGDHSAIDLHYYYTLNDFNFKYRFIDIERDFTDLGGTTVENQRHAMHFDYSMDEWLFYLEVTQASSDTIGNDANATAVAPGVSYNYGPGWLYLEYLSQDGFIGATGDVGEGDFSALYISFDYYF